MDIPETDVVSIAIHPAMEQLHATLSSFRSMLVSSVIASVAISDSPDLQLQAPKKLLDEIYPGWRSNCEALGGDGILTTDGLRSAWMRAAAITALVQSFGALEEYIRKRVSDEAKRSGTGYRWSGGHVFDQPVRARSNKGPLYTLIHVGFLREAETPVLAESLLCGDLYRCIRHHIAHSPSEHLPKAGSNQVRRWIYQQLYVREDTDYHDAEKIEGIFNSVMREVEGRHAGAQLVKPGLPLEFLYAIMGADQFEKIGLEIEEAMIPAGNQPSGRIPFRRAWVRRQDLIVNLPKNNAG
jgi:hypothetical protein